ncbi:MAG: glutaredoxin family protein [Candidatus Brocadiia bacterium]
MEMKRVSGKKKGSLTLYALSTCIWCRRVKELLNSMGVEYDYVDVDLLEGEDKNKATEEIKKWNPKMSFPNLIVNNQKCIVGFDEPQIKEALK